MKRSDERRQSVEVTSTWMAPAAHELPQEHEVKLEAVARKTVEQ